MKIEKLDENKIKITFNNEDLEKNNITFHSFMSNSIESQSLFLSLLDEAEKTVGFITDNYKITIEALTLNNGYFILIISRFNDKNISKSKKKLHSHRKQNNISNKLSIYKFDNFEDFCKFCTYTKYYAPELIQEFYNKNSLYEYKKSYYFITNQISLSINTIKFCSFITEFATFINISQVSHQKLIECGNLIMKNNALDTCISSFSL